MDLWNDMQARLDELAAAGLLRRPATVETPPAATVTVDGRELVCLCSNDYLSLANDPAVRDAAVQAVRRWGVGAGASRLVSGTTAAHRQLERRLAEFKRTEAALVTSTGWQANHAAVSAIAGPGDMICCDKLNHASIIDAARCCGARLRTYPHGDLTRLARLLEKHRRDHRRCAIVTDSLFSMDGDLAPLAGLADLKRRFDAALMIDEAHATGVLGESGRGAAELLGVEDEIDVTVGTLSKALGALGGFVAGPGVLVETLVNTARSFIYTTALPPALCAAAAAALDVVGDEPERRTALLDKAARLRERLRSAGLDTGGSASQIIPIVAGDAAHAVRASATLLEAGFFVPAIRPPTVPRGASRLRVSLCSAHTDEQLDVFAAAAIAAIARR